MLNKYDIIYIGKLDNNEKKQILNEVAKFSLKIDKNIEIAYFIETLDIKVLPIGISMYYKGNIDDGLKNISNSSMVIDFADNPHILRKLLESEIQIFQYKNLQLKIKDRISQFNNMKELKELIIKNISDKEKEDKIKSLSNDLKKNGRKTLQEKIFYIDPQQIKFAMINEFNIKNYSNDIIAGDWDLEIVPFEKRVDFYESFKNHLKGKAWEETAYFKRVINEINQGYSKWGCVNKQDLLKRCYKLDSIYISMRENGFIQNQNNDYISINIGRNGEIIFNNGRHRVSFAKLLGIKKIPVKITVRHSNWVSFKNEIIEYANRNNNGRVYAPLIHVDLAEIPSVHKGRFEKIKPFVSKESKTVLDIGTHWGYMCSMLESELGKECFAVEKLKTTYYFLEKIKIANNMKYHTIQADIFEFTKKFKKFDTVLALAIFHHFIKTPELYSKLKEMLKNLEMNEMIFQAHKTDERQMQTAYKNFESLEFVNFIIDNSCLTNFEQIADFDGRKVYRIFRNIQIGKINKQNSNLSPNIISSDTNDFVLELVTEKKIKKDQIFYINPQKIKSAMLKEFSIDQFSGKIVSGNWDEKIIPIIEKDDFYDSFRSRLNGESWKNTSFYKLVLSDLNQGKIKWGCKTETDLINKCLELESVYFSIQKNGFIENNEKNYLSINIGRNGELILNNEIHLLVFYKLLGFAEIPVKIIVRHLDWIRFKNEVISYALDNKKRKIYAPIYHVDLADIPSVHKGRFEKIKPFVSKESKTVLDIGTHWGYMCSMMESELGKECFAVEKLEKTFYFLNKIKIANNMKYHTIKADIFEFTEKFRQFDTVLALAIFHHFIKTPELFSKFKRMLKNLKMNEMIFQAHKTDERQMQTAYKNFESLEFVNFIIDNSCLTNFEKIADFDGREVYRIYKKEQQILDKKEIESSDLYPKPAKKILFLGFLNSDYFELMEKLYKQYLAMKKINPLTEILIIGKGNGVLKDENLPFKFIDLELIMSGASRPKRDKMSTEIASKYILTNNIDWIYFRFPFSNEITLAFVKRHKNIIIEYQSKQLEEFDLRPNKKLYNTEKKYGKEFLNSLAGIVGGTDEVLQYQKEIAETNLKGITLPNGIDVSGYEMSKKIFSGMKIHLLYISMFMQPWQGVDRIINGLKLYNGKYDFHIHVIGNYEQEYINQIMVNKLDKKFSLYGVLDKKNISIIAENCEVGIGALAVHRKGQKEVAAIKLREYCARGIPFVFAANDPDFSPNLPFVHQYPLNDSPIDFSEIEKLALKAREDKMFRQRIRDFAFQNLTWEMKMRKLDDFINRLSQDKNINKLFENTNPQNINLEQSVVQTKTINEQKKLKILFICHDFPPYRLAGAQLYARNLAQKINSSGKASVEILHPVFRKIQKENHYKIIQNDKFDLTIFELIKPLVEEPLKIYDKNVEIALYSFLQKNPYDVIHFHGLGQLSLAPIFVVDKLNIKSVMTFHDHWFLCDHWHMIRKDNSICSGPENLQKCSLCYIEDKNLSLTNNWKEVLSYQKYRKEMMKLAFSHIDYKTAPSQYLCDIFKKYSMPDIQMKSFGFIYNDVKMNKRRYTKDSKIVFGYSGQIIKVKGLDFLIEAFKDLPNSNIELHIWGRMLKEKEYTKQILKSCADDKRIKIMGEYELWQLEEIFSTFDIAIVSSLKENYPLVVQEAFINKVPVIATNVGGIPEVVQNNNNGLLVEPRNSNRLSEAMRKIINNPQLINIYKDNIKTVRKLEKDAEFCYNIYQDLLQNSFVDSNKKNRKFTVQFYIYKNVHWPMFENLYHYLKNRNDVEKIIFCLPDLTQLIAGDGHKFVKELFSLKEIVVANPRKYKVDVTFIADTIAGKVKDCGKIVNIGHGTISKGYYFTQSVWTERENWVDLLCVPGEYAKQQLSEILTTKVIATGMPKLDPVFSGKFDKKYLIKKFNLDSSKKIILYAPTFNIDLSSIYDFADRFHELHSNDYYVLIKLHGSTPPQTIQQFEILAEKYPFYIFVKDPNLAPYLAGSDLMISDVSSAFMEFMALDKPVILYNNPKTQNYHGYNPENIEYKWRNLGNEINSFDELKSIIPIILNGDNKSEIRKKYAQKLFADLKGKASENVWKETKKIIKDKIVNKIPVISIILKLNSKNLFAIREKIHNIQFYSVLPIELVLIIEESSDKIEKLIEITKEFNQFYSLKCIKNEKKDSFLVGKENSSGDYIMFMEANLNVFKNFDYIVYKTFINNPNISIMTGLSEVIEPSAEHFIKFPQDMQIVRYAYEFIWKYQGNSIENVYLKEIPPIIIIRKNVHFSEESFQSFMTNYLSHNKIALTLSFYYNSINKKDYLTLQTLFVNYSRLQPKERIDIGSDVLSQYFYSDIAEVLWRDLLKYGGNERDILKLMLNSCFTRYYDLEYKEEIYKYLKNIPEIEKKFSLELRFIRELKSNLVMKSEIENKTMKRKILFYFFKNVHIPIMIPIYKKYIEIFPEDEIAFGVMEYAPKIRAGFLPEELEMIKKFGEKIFFVPQDFQPDLTFIADSVYPWVQDCGKIVNVGHGILSKGQYYTNTETARREEQADLICVPGKYHAEIMRKIISKPVIATGMAKLDKLFSGEINKKSVCKKYNLPFDRKYILFAPTFNDELSAIPFVMDRINEVIPDDNTLMIIKLHGSTKEEYREMYKQLVKKDSRIIYASRGEVDIVPFLALCDLMISDVSSTMIEFIALNKPIILFNNPNWEKYKNYNSQDIEFNCRNIGIQVTSLQEMKQAVKFSIENPNNNSAQREYFSGLLLENWKTADASLKIVTASHKLLSEHSDQELEKTSKFWGRIERKKKIHFWDIPTIKKYRNKLISNNENLGFMDWFKDKYVASPFKNGLSLGCGSGYLERYAIDNLLVEQITGIDISSERIKIAKEKRGNRKIKYLEKNLNNLSMNSKFDLIIAKMILHHINNLEGLLKEVSNCLTDNGLIYVSEYIGPNRFQFSSKIIELMNRILLSIPDKYRVLNHGKKLIKSKVNVIPVKQIVNADPTEAIRSEEIDALIHKYFKVVESHHTGGTLLFWMLDGISQNFDNSEESIGILKRLTVIEQSLIDSKEIPEHFKVYVLRKHRKK